MKRSTQVRLDPKVTAQLRKIAKSLGFTQRQGPTTGQGSVVQLLEAVARGDLQIEKSTGRGSERGETENP